MTAPTTDRATALVSPVVGLKGSAPAMPVGLPPVPMARVTRAKLISNVLLTGVGLLFALPLLWLIFASLDSQATYGIELPHLTLHNFSDSLAFGGFRALEISFAMAGIATAVATFAGAPAAYAFSRRHIPWKGPVLLAVLFISGVPITVLIVPVFQMFSSLGWLSLIPTSVFLGVTSLPFEIWMIKNFMDAVPVELEEAARIERAGTLQILRRIVVPLALPGISAAAIFGFVNAWGSFLIPLVLLQDQSQQPGQVRIYGFIGTTQIKYGDIAAYSLLYSIPVVGLYLILSRLFRGKFVLGGAVKG